MKYDYIQSWIRESGMSKEESSQDANFFSKRSEILNNRITKMNTADRYC